MTDELKPSIGRDCGYWIGQDGQRHYYETQPSKTVQAATQTIERHRSILERIGEDTYHRFIFNLVCNPFRRDDWSRRL
jgi:hypothetical protein